VHPRMMLKVLFYSYAKGVYSSREMEDRMRWDPNYIYLSANQRVDHSTICNFILKYGEEIKRVFSQLVYLSPIGDGLTITRKRSIFSLKWQFTVFEFASHSLLEGCEHLFVSLLRPIGMRGLSSR